MVAAIKAGYAKTDSTFLHWARKRRRKDGSTAVTCLLLGKQLFVGWAGDSRAVLLGQEGKAAWISADHKPDRPDEKARVEAAGGVVFERGCWRVSTKAGMDYVRRHGKACVSRDDICTHTCTPPCKIHTAYA